MVNAPLKFTNGQIRKIKILIKLGKNLWQITAVTEMEQGDLQGQRIELLITKKYVLLG